MNRRKMIGLVASVVAAAIGTLFIVKYSSGKTPPPPVAAPAEATVTVLKVTQPIPKGTPAAQLANFVQPVQVPASAKNAEAATSMDELKDLVANSDLLVNEQVSKMRFSPAAQVAAASAAAAAEDPNNGLIGVWVPFSDPVKALNGNLKPGVTKVAVFALFTPIAATGGDPTAAVPTNHLLLHHVPVLDVFATPAAAPAPAPAPAPDGQPAPPVSTIPPLALQVKLGVDAPSAERLVYAITNGTIYLGEEPDSSPESAPTKIVERGNVYDSTNKVAPVRPTIIGAKAIPSTTLKPGAKPVTAAVAPAAKPGTPAPAPALPPVGAQPVSAQPVAVAAPGAAPAAPPAAPAAAPQQ